MRGILTLLAAVALAAPALAQMDDGNTTDETTGGAPTGPMDGSATSVTIEEAVGDQVCWTVTGTGRVGHVAIHWDDTSHQAATANATTGVDANGTATNGTGTGTVDTANATFADYDLGFAYPDNTVELAAEGYTLPGRFCANVTRDANATTGTTGTLYVVAHVMDVSGAPGLLSREIMVTSTTTGGTTTDDTTGTGTDTTTGNGTDDGAPQEANPPRSDTPAAGVVAALAVLGIAAYAARRRP